MATCRVSAARLGASGAGNASNPAFSSCQTYSLAEPQSSGLFTSPPADNCGPQAFGLGPELLLALVTKRRLPSTETCTAVGYQPVGTRPLTRETPAPFAPRAVG